MAEDFELFSSLRYDKALLQVAGSDLTHAGWNWANRSPLYMLDFHRDRILRAATHWGWDAAIDILSGEAGLKRLEEFILSSLGENISSPMRVRVSITKLGQLKIVTGPVSQTPLENLFPEVLPPPEGIKTDKTSTNMPVKSPEYMVMVDQMGSARSEYTHFKTSKRAVYDGARQRAQIGLLDLKEVLIVSETTGDIMEGSVTTPYFWRDGRWVTPAVSKEYSAEKGSGGQDGTSRRWALERYVNLR